MILKAIVKCGLVNGVAAGLSLHWIIVALLYERLYEFSWPRFIDVPLNWLAVIILPISLLSIGPFAIFLSKGDIRTRRQGFQVGASTGIIVGVAIYLLVGALANVLGLGTVPLIGYLAEPSKLAGIELFDVLQPIVSNALVFTYLIIIAHILIGGLIGGVEGWIFMMVRMRRSDRISAVS